MKDYKVRATRDFDDLVDKVKRVKGKSEWYCTKERYEFLKEHNAVELIEKPEVFVGYTQVIEEPAVEKVIKVKPEIVNVTKINEDIPSTLTFEKSKKKKSKKKGK